ncbi:hypothetical protein BG004_000082 [Podila humilis]|nr:hypothetical protein BG004_000082 [Podila humilis]
MAPPQFKVIIAGGGISGLSLGVMLERAGIDYIILEAHDEIRPLGAVVYLGPSLMKVMEQLGLLDDLIRHSNFMTGVTLFDHKMNKICRLNIDFARERYGYDTLTIVRPKLYDILLSRIPAYKILFGKKVSSSAQNHDGVKVRCEDGTNYTGDILVAADGGASPIRESFYEEIRKRSKKLSHPSDYARPKLDQRCVVGVTKPMDPKQYPALAIKECELFLVMPKAANCMVWFVPMTENRFGWGVTSPIQASISDPGAAQRTGEKESQKSGTGRSSSSVEIPTEDRNHSFNTSSTHTNAVNRMTQTFSAMSPSSYSPPSSATPSPISSPSHLSDFESFPLSPQQQHHQLQMLQELELKKRQQLQQQQQQSTGLQRGTSLRKRQSFGVLSKVSTSGSTGSQPTFQKYPAVLTAVHGGGSGNSDVESSGGGSYQSASGVPAAGPDLPYDRVWASVDEKYTIEDSIREQASPFGGVFGEFVDATAKNMISMVVVEEKFYHTWHFGRTVLLGDACHKLLPSSGHGSTQAILDAISLVSLLVELPSNSPTDIDALFRVHFERRGPAAKEAVVAAQQQDQLLFNRNMSGKIIRKLASNWIGEWVQVKMGDRLFDSRPMLHFMKPVPDRGTHRNKDSTVPLLQDKRFDMARRKSISSGEIARHSSEDAFEGFREQQEKKSKKKKGSSSSQHHNKSGDQGIVDSSFDSSPFSSSMPSILRGDQPGYSLSGSAVPAVPVVPPIHRPISTMVEGTIVPHTGPRQDQQETEVIGLRNSHWHLYQDFSYVPEQQK